MFADDLVVVCTEKDAVKLRELEMDLTHVWALRIELGFACDMSAELDALLADKGIAPRRPGSAATERKLCYDGPYRYTCTLRLNSFARKAAS